MRGPFRSQEEAAQEAAEWVGCTVSELRKDVSYTPEERRERFLALISIYSNGKEGPEDYHSLVQHAKDSMFKDEPAMLWFSIWSKYGPFRDTMAKVWAKNKNKKHMPKKVVTKKALKNDVKA